jgi:hypothetical protein
MCSAAGTMRGQATRFARILVHVVSVLAVMTLAIGCVDEPEDVVVERIVFNAIPLSEIADSSAQLTQMTATKISLANPGAQQLLVTAAGREVLAYLIDCAMPKHVTLYGSSGGTTYGFVGNVGLAPSWKNGYITPAEKRYVSACMFAKVNAYRTSMKISLRGPQGALHVTQSEANQYTLEEGVFYGDIFTGSNPVVGWGCRGHAKATNHDEFNSGLDARDCSQQGDGANRNSCGFGFSGDCFDFGLGAAVACDARSADVPIADGASSNGVASYYGSCHNADRTQTWNEVITVYVRPGPPSVD